MTARDPKFTWVYCSVCGVKIAKKPGVVVVEGLVCTRPLCNFEPEVTIHEQRDGLLVAAYLAGIPVAFIASANGMSRQRVYQIITTWKQGV